MTKILNQDRDCAARAARTILEYVWEELQLDAHDAIPGLMLAALSLAAYTDNPNQALDEAVRLLETDIE